MNPNEIIEQSLQYGEKRAISRARLAEISGLDVRDVCRCIEDLRRKGVLICSSSRGYYYPETKRELERHARKEHNRAASILCSVRAADAALRQWEDDAD